MPDNAQDRAAFTYNAAAEAAVASLNIIGENRLHPINSPEDWWAIVLGSGYPGTIEQLNPPDGQKVKEANMALICDENISTVETNVLYALVTKPQTARPNED